MSRFCTRCEKYVEEEEKFEGGNGMERRERTGRGVVSLQISDVGARYCDSQMKSGREHQAAT